MPIYIYECPEGHTVEFLKLHKDEVEPEFCKAYTTKTQPGTNRPETFICGLPLKKVIAPVNWKYTRGKNVNWPLTEETVPEDPHYQED